MKLILAIAAAIIVVAICLNLGNAAITKANRISGAAAPGGIEALITQPTK